MKIEDDGKDLIIPQKYSRRIFMNTPLLLFLGWTSHQKNFTLVKYITPCLLVSSWIHWNRPRHNSTIRKIDWVLAIAMVISITRYEKRYRTLDRYLWRLSVCMQLLAVCYNSIRFTLETDPRYVFYTRPGTNQREDVYRWCVHTHMVFVHLLPCLAATLAIRRSRSVL